MKINHPERYVGKRVRVVSLQGTATAGQFIGYNYDYDDNGNEFVEFDIDADFGDHPGLFHPNAPTRAADADQTGAAAAGDGRGVRTD